jgi:hypothetical protein
MAPSFRDMLTFGLVDIRNVSEEPAASICRAEDWTQRRFNLECLHPVACVRSGDAGFLYPSTQRHYRRLILLLMLLYCYMFRSYDHLQAENILLARITQLTTDPLDIL